MDKPTLAILLTLGVHLAGIAVLLWLALAGNGFAWHDWWPRDDEDGGGEGDPEAPEPAPPGGGVPLPDAEPLPARLRTEHDAVPRRRSRRPEHAPERAPAPSRP